MEKYIPSDEAVAWFFMADGHVGIDVWKCSEARLGYKVAPRVSFVNTDTIIIAKIAEWLKSNGFSDSVTDSHTERKTPLSIAQVSHSFKGVERLLKILAPYLIGKKKEQCDLTLKACGFKRSPCGGLRYIPLESERQRFLELVRLSQEVRKLQGLRAKTKYTVEYFEELWGGE